MKPLNAAIMKKAQRYDPPKYFVDIDHNACIMCGLCVQGCTFDALSVAPTPDGKGRIAVKDDNCTACEYCMAVCPVDCIDVGPNQAYSRSDPLWPAATRHRLFKQGQKGGMILTSMGSPEDGKTLWDHLALDAAQVTNPPIDPLREPMELRTYVGRKDGALRLSYGESGDIGPAVGATPQLKLEIPLIFAAMSYGAVSVNVQRALAMAARELGIFLNIGEGGLHDDLRPHRDRLIVQCASARFGVDPEYLNAGAAVEIKIGQGAKPGIGGHLPARKVVEEIARTRRIPVGTDALSPAPHHDIYSIEDLRQLIYALREATGYERPVGVKVAAVNHIASIASGIARAGADFITIDGQSGGTGAAPQAVRDNVGIPIELALAAVDDRLREEGLRQEITLIVSGSIKTSADWAKAIALGADAAAIGSPALIALGCRMIRQCHTNKCPWGIATQDPELVKRLDPEKGAEQVVNMVRAWTLELQEFLGAMGMNAVESLRGNRERLRAIGLGDPECTVLGVKHAGM